MQLSLRNYRRIAQAALTRRVPVYAHYGITHRCNLTCKMCGIWRYGNAAEELSLAEIERMAARMARIGVVQVAIGGGEPFAVDHLEGAARAFVREGLHLRILTNGVGLDLGRVDACIEAGVRQFSISLDSLDPARFDDICEHEGAWREAVRTITHVGEALAGVRGALPTINCVVSNLNLEEIPDIVRFARDVGFAVSLLPVELLPDPKAGVRNWEARFVRYRPEMATHLDPERVAERVDRTYDEVRRMKREGWPILNSTPYLEASRAYLKTGAFPAEGCDAGRLYFSVAPNGQFTICHRAQHRHLHILDPDFERYFRSEEYERKRLDEVGSCEGCMRACWIDTSAMFRTLQGFYETARVTFAPRTRRPLGYAEALERARPAAAAAAAG